LAKTKLNGGIFEMKMVCQNYYEVPHTLTHYSKLNLAMVSLKVKMVAPKVLVFSWHSKLYKARQELFTSLSLKFLVKFFFPLPLSLRKAHTGSGTVYNFRLINNYQNIILRQAKETIN
jgi:hypothetical protein